MRTEKDPMVIVTVPWPIRLFGDMQNYLGMSAICVACNIPTAITVTPREDNIWSLTGQNAKAQITLDRHATVAGKQRSSFARVITALAKKGYVEKGGFDFQLHSRVHGIDGFPDSPAMIVAWTLAILALSDRHEEFTPLEIAELACAALPTDGLFMVGSAEVHACVLGGTIRIRTSNNARPEIWPLERKLPGIVMGWTSSHAQWGLDRILTAGHETNAILQKIKSAQSGQFNLPETTLEQAIALAQELSEHETGIIYAQVMMREICNQAYELIESEYGLDDDRFAEMLDGTHEMLRDYFNLSSEKVEDLIQIAVKSGALGCKVIPETNSFIAFGPEREEDIIAAIKRAGGLACSAPLSNGICVQA